MTRLRVLAAGLLASACLPVSAAANIVDFAAGEQYVGVPTGSFEHTDAAYWTERRDLRAYTPALWRTLRAHRATISVNLHFRRDFGPVPKGKPRIRDAMPILRAAARYRVPVNAWLVVPYSDGYWSHEGNAGVTEAAVRSFVAWARASKLRFRGVLLDLESSLQDTRTFAKLRQDPAGAMEAFRRNTSPLVQCAAARRYAAIPRYLRARGYRAIAAAYPFVLDDVSDGNIALQDGLNAPLLMPGQYDLVGFMAMRTVMNALLGSDTGSSVYASYQESAKRYFPREGGLVLGVAGDPPYNDLATLAHDVRVAATVSDKPLGMYSLESLRGKLGLAGVKAVLAASRQPLTGEAAEAAGRPSPGTLALRQAVVAEDRGIATATPGAAVSRGEAPVLPNPYPRPCGL